MALRNRILMQIDTAVLLLLLSFYLIFQIVRHDWYDSLERRPVVMLTSCGLVEQEEKYIFEKILWIYISVLQQFSEYLTE